MKTKEILSLQQSTIEKTINLIKSKQNHIQYLQRGNNVQKIEEQLKAPYTISKIKKIESNLIKQVCSELPHALWQRKQHMVELPYIK